MESKNISYLDLLPKDLNEKLLLRLPLNQLFKVCGASSSTEKICKDSRFWYMRAKSDIDPDITWAWFNEYPGSAYGKYIRILAYIPQIVPGMCTSGVGICTLNKKLISGTKISYPLIIVSN